MRLLFIMILPLLSAGMPIHAETLVMPDTTGDVSATRSSVPAKGMTMEQVEAKFGTPHDKLPAIGNPPICRWVYDDYTVYFERQYVIHTVVNH